MDNCAARCSRARFPPIHAFCCWTNRSPGWTRGNVPLWKRLLERLMRTQLTLVMAVHHAEDLPCVV